MPHSNVIDICTNKILIRIDCISVGHPFCCNNNNRTTATKPGKIAAAAAIAASHKYEVSIRQQERQLK